MNAALLASALALGVAGAPHCVAMCAAPCAAATARGGQAGFQMARALGYAAAGAVAAGGINAVGWLAQASPAFKPVWALVHAAAFALGLWLLLRGRQPAWLERWGRRPVAAQAGTSDGWQALHGPVQAMAAGALWVAWPCGLLQSAVLVAALGNGPAEGAAIMLMFAAGSSSGLLAAPWIWRRLGGSGSGSLVRTGAVRMGGLLLALASAWALGHDLWIKLAAYCGLT